MCDWLCARPDLAAGVVMVSLHVVDEDRRSFILSKRSAGCFNVHIKASSITTSKKTLFQAGGFLD